MSEIMSASEMKIRELLVYELSPEKVQNVLAVVKAQHSLLLSQGVKKDELKQALSNEKIYREKYFNLKEAYEAYSPLADFIQKGNYPYLGEHYGDVAIKVIEKLESKLENALAAEKNYKDAYYSLKSWNGVNNE